VLETPKESTDAFLLEIKGVSAVEMKTVCVFYFSLTISGVNWNDLREHVVLPADANF
jgi:hypothetical protein